MNVFLITKALILLVFSKIFQWKNWEYPYTSLHTHLKWRKAYLKKPFDYSKKMFHNSFPMASQNSSFFVGKTESIP